MKQLLFFSLVFLLFNLPAQTQSLSKAVFRVTDNSTHISSLEITIDNLIIVIDNNGNIVSFNSILGGEYEFWMNDYIGKRDGKLKSIGDVDIDYWTNDFMGRRDGKLKSIGNIVIDYWFRDYIGKRNGKLKSIGDVNIDYWTDNDYTGKRGGKLKSVGDISIDYWTNDLFGERDGKLKSIGNINIDYWTDRTIDSNGREGKIKSITGNSPQVYALYE